MRQKLKQFIGFGLVGGVNTILTYLIYLTLYQLINPTAAMGVGYGLTSILAYFLMTHGCSRQKIDANSKRWHRVIISYGLTFILSLVLTSFWNDFFTTTQAACTYVRIDDHCPNELPFKQVLGISKRGVAAHEKKLNSGPLIGGLLAF